MISIILNVYNGEKYIKRCVESVLAQTYQNFELLIIDDGSTDSTAKIRVTSKSVWIRHRSSLV